MKRFQWDWGAWVVFEALSPSSLCALQEEPELQLVTLKSSLMKQDSCCTQGKKLNTKSYPIHCQSNGKARSSLHQGVTLTSCLAYQLFFMFQFIVLTPCVLSSSLSNPAEINEITPGSKFCSSKWKWNWAFRASSKSIPGRPGVFQLRAVTELLLPWMRKQGWAFCPLKLQPLRKKLCEVFWLKSYSKKLSHQIKKTIKFFTEKQTYECRFLHKVLFL